MLLSRSRQGDLFMRSTPIFPLVQEAALELPLGYAPAYLPGSGIAVLLHVYHIDLLAEMRAYLSHIPFAADMFISTDTTSKQNVIAACFADWNQGSVTIEVTPNRGRDVAPKLVGFARVHAQYEYVLHVHTKQSFHDDRLAGWRGYLFDTLLGSADVVRGIFAAFEQAPELGMLAPQHIDELRPWIRWLVNYDQAAALAARMGFDLRLDAPIDFPSGSMFWARSSALKPLLDLQLKFEDFPDERGQTDGTLAHAIERLYFLACEQAGFSWMKITAKGELHDQSGVVAVRSDEELKRFLAQKRVNLFALRDTIQEYREAQVITSAPPKPRRVLHVLWRHALGRLVTVPPGLCSVIVLRAAAAAAEPLIRDAGLALRALPAGGSGQVILGAKLSAQAAFAAGFATGADLVLVVDRPGILHPGSVAALIRMAQAHAGVAVMEAACVPEWKSTAVDVNDLTVASAGGPAWAMTAKAFETLGGLDEQLSEQDAALNLSQRAQALGMPVLRCLQAMFYPLIRPMPGSP